MAETVNQLEDQPAAYPSTPEGLLGAAAAALDAAFLWARLEAYTARRWPAREVVWIIEGPGEWRPPLYPATVDTVETWNGSTWAPATPAASPFGGYDFEAGAYRVTATVGDDTDPPAEVWEAFKRLAEYAAAEPEAIAGAVSVSIGLGDLQEKYRRDPAYVARALDWSGAADLLRSYRRP